VLRLLGEGSFAAAITTSARRRLEERFDVEVMARAHEQMYADAAARRTRSG
jgi:hypothetical protein